LDIIKKSITYIMMIFIAMIFSSLYMNLHNSNLQINITNNLAPFKLKDTEITNIPNNKTDIITSPEKSGILSIAKAMTEVKWTPKSTMVDVSGHYTFVKGKTYTGIPYSMGSYQTSSANDFLSKIIDSNKILGNDCSGFVSAAWGISRQTTLSLFNSANSGNKINGKSVIKIPWDDLKPGDALLLDNGKGKGHVVLYINTEAKNNDSLHIYEQNVATFIPFNPIPVARESTRSKRLLQSQGYFPIRLKS